MKDPFKLYISEFKKLTYILAPAVATGSSLSGALFSTNASVAGYAFPPVGGSRPIAGILCLVAIVIALLLGSTFINIRQTTLLTFGFAGLALVSIVLYLHGWQKTVVTAPIPSIQSSQSIVIGSTRTALANPMLNDEQLVEREGDTDDRIYLYYTKDSTDRNRLVMCLIYGALLLSVTLCTATIVAGRVRTILKLD